MCCSIFDIPFPLALVSVSISRLIEAGDHTKFKADWGLVSLAAGTIYGCNTRARSFMKTRTDS